MIESEQYRQRPAAGHIGKCANRSADAEAGDHVPGVMHPHVDPRHGDHDGQPEGCKSDPPAGSDARSEQCAEHQQVVRGERGIGGMRYERGEVLNHEWTRLIPGKADERSDSKRQPSSEAERETGAKAIPMNPKGSQEDYAEKDAVAGGEFSSSVHVVPTTLRASSTAGAGAWATKAFVAVTEYLKHEVRAKAGSQTDHAFAEPGGANSFGHRNTGRLGRCRE